ncbi:MAG: ubiquinone/menaquinone biosynthesis methyltransferase [Anaerolineales bacterium]
MPDLSREKQPDQQQDLFTRIADRYDVINHLMTGWQDVRWRRSAVRQLALHPGARLLDIGSGNGQISKEASRQFPDCSLVSADLTQSMMLIGRQKASQIPIHWTAADANQLPFPEGSFDGVISGFLVRNLGDIVQGLKEQYRVLKPGGRIAVLDTSKPPRNMLTPVIRFYMTRIIPALGSLLTGYREAYQYLTASTEEFLRAEELAAYLAAVGFKKVAYQQMSLGVIAVHWGEK